MATLAIDGIVDIHRSRRRSLLRLLAPLLTFSLLLGGVVGGRALVERHRAADPALITSAATAMPTSTLIEERWGIRFTAATLLADGGMIEIRYLVLDPAKGSRIHSGDVKDLPVVRAEDSGREVRSYSLMFHIHTDHAGADVDGRNYSIIYGNANGAARFHGLVTIVLPDGLRLEHVPVS